MPTKLKNEVANEIEVAKKKAIREKIIDSEIDIIKDLFNL